MPHLSSSEDFEEREKEREQLLKRKIAALPKDNILKQKFRKEESGNDMEEISQKLFSPLSRELHESRKAFIEGVPFDEIMEDYKELIDVCVKIYDKDKVKDKTEVEEEIDEDVEDNKIRKEGEKSEKESLSKRLEKALSLDEKNKGQTIKPEDN